jgi:hypothetical protein
MITLLFLICFTPFDSKYPTGFTIGEKLDYAAKFSFINLGSMTLEIEDTLTYKGFTCYGFTSILTSNPSLSFLFSLSDTIEVYARTEDLLPIYYEESINEGKYHNHSKLFFDHDSLNVIYDDSLSFDLLEKSRDLLSFWYFLRTIPLEVGDTIPVNIHKSKENYEILCHIEKKERIKTPIGEFNTILVSPQTEGKGIFGSGGEMDIWYSDDEARYPVQIKAKMKFGSVLFKLKGVKN